MGIGQRLAYHHISALPVCAYRCPCTSLVCRAKRIHQPGNETIGTKPLLPVQSWKRASKPAYACKCFAKASAAEQSSILVRPATKEDIRALAEIEKLSQGYWNERELQANEVQIIEVAVHPAFRRQGIGLALMSEALKQGTRKIRQKAGRGSAVLEVRTDNEAAVTLYHKLGFQIVYTRRDYYPDGGDAYSMRIRV